MILAISLLFAASLFGISFAALDAVAGHSASSRNRFQDRLRDITYSNQEVTSTLEKKYFYSDIKALEKLLKKQVFVRRLNFLLELTGWGISASTFILSSLLAAFLVYYLTIRAGWIMAASLFVSILTLAVVPKMILMFHYNRYMNKFGAHFPKALQVIRGAVQAGLGLNTSLERVALDCPYPLNKEFRRILDQMSLGKSFIESLLAMKERIPTMDVRTFVLALTVQQESGGNLAELLTNLEDTITTRVVMRKELRALTAQGRASGLVLAILPIAVFIIINLVNHSYLNEFKTDLGKKLMMLGIGLQFLGFIWIQKIVSIKLRT